MVILSALDDDNTASPILPSIYDVIAVASFAIALVGIPLMVLFQDQQGHVMVWYAAIAVFVGAFSIWFGLYLTRRRQIQPVLVVIIFSVIVGTATGLVIFSPGDYSYFGLVVCVPIALIAGLAGYGLLLVSKRLPWIRAYLVGAGVLTMASSVVVAIADGGQ